MKTYKQLLQENESLSREIARLKLSMITPEYYNMSVNARDTLIYNLKNELKKCKEITEKQADMIYKYNANEIARALQVRKDTIKELLEKLKNI